MNKTINLSLGMLRHLRWMAFIICLSALSSGCKTPSASGVSSPSQASNLPAGTAVSPANYVLGPEDQVVVTVWRQDDLKTETTIDPSGNILMPLIGQVKAAGLPPADLAKNIEAKMAAFLQEPKVNVAVTNVGSRKIHVLGEVKMPGTYPMSSDMNVWEAVAKAGGFSSDANLKSIILVREMNQGAKKIALAEAVRLNSPVKTGTAVQELPRLRNRDIVFVPTSGLSKVSNFMTKLDNILRPFLDTASVIVLGNSAYEVLFPEEVQQQTRQTGPIAISP